MAQPVRWLLVIASTVATFVVCLLLVRLISFSWMPQTETDRWAVAAAFAAVAAGSVGTAMGQWAGHEKGNESQHRKVSTKGDSLKQAACDEQKPIFGPSQEYPYEESNSQSEKPVTQEPDSPSSLDVSQVRDEPHPTGGNDGKAIIIQFPDRGVAHIGGQRSWGNLVKILRQTSLDGQDYVALAFSTRQLREELEIDRTPDPTVPESAQRFVNRLKELLKIIINSSTSPEDLETSLSEARTTMDLLVRLLTPN